MLSLAHRRRSITTLAALLVGCAFVGSVPTPQQNAKRDLIVFVGKRLSVKQQTAEPDSLDQKFEARYRVLQLVFGRYEGAEITFTAYDHYGIPPFAQDDTALMFVSRYEGRLYHEKYQFFPVYPTVDGRWATCGDPDRWEGRFHHGKLKRVPIKFAGKVIDEPTGRSCTDGNYVEDLLLMKKNGVLKARGWIF